MPPLNLSKNERDIFKDALELWGHEPQTVKNS